MRPLIYALLCATLILGCQTNSSQKKPKKSELHLRLGTSHLSKGNYPQALKELRLAAKYDRTNPIIYNNLGLAYLVRGRYLQAEEQVRKAIVINPEYTEARNNLGRILIHQKKYKDAISELQIAVNDLTFPAPEKSLSNLGIAYFMVKDYARAEDNLKRSLRLRRKHCSTQNYYGRTLLEQNFYSKALESLESSIESCDKTKFYEPRYYGALASFKLGRIEQAVAKLEEVIYLDPDGKFGIRSSELLVVIKDGR